MGTFRAVVKIADPILGGTGVNVFHGHLADDDPDDLGPLMVSVHSAYEDSALLFPSTTEITWDGTATTLGSSPMLLEALDDAWSTAGTGGTHPAPPANCLVVGFSTALRTRSGRGRTFLGPLDRDQVQDNGTPYEATRDIVAGTWQDVIDSQTGNPNYLGVWSPTDEVLRQWTSAKVANRFAVLRSRRD